MASLRQLVCFLLFITGFPEVLCLVLGRNDPNSTISPQEKWSISGTPYIKQQIDVSNFEIEHFVFEGDEITLICNASTVVGRIKWYAWQDAYGTTIHNSSSPEWYFKVTFEGTRQYTCLVGNRHEQSGRSSTFGIITLGTLADVTPAFEWSPNIDLPNISDTPDIPDVPDIPDMPEIHVPDINLPDEVPDEPEGTSNGYGHYYAYGGGGVVVIVIPLGICGCMRRRRRMVVVRRGDRAAIIAREVVPHGAASGPANVNGTNSTAPLQQKA